MKLKYYIAVLLLVVVLSESTVYAMGKFRLANKAANVLCNSMAGGGLGGGLGIGTGLAVGGFAEIGSHVLEISTGINIDGHNPDNPLHYNHMMRGMFVGFFPGLIAGSLISAGPVGPFVCAGVLGSVMAPEIIDRAKAVLAKETND